MKNKNNSAKNSNLTKQPQKNRKNLLKICITNEQLTQKG